MIHSIRGRLREKSPTSMVLEVGGIGFFITIPLSTFDALPETGQEGEVLIHLNVREDALDLYGFYSEEELALFRHLIGVTKIGPKLAIGILSGTSPEEFKRRIVAGDVGALVALPGIGPKTAKRIIVELKEKFVPTDIDELIGVGEGAEGEFETAMAALATMGYSRSEAFRVLTDMKRNGEFEGEVEDIVKRALSKR
ncbi:MAG: Holliday junction branch migration protein RuvA [Fidelibacterota bacterium]